jgi:DNA-binding response OmpR family regulator
MATTNPKRILLADDNRAIATVVQFVLEQAGFEVMLACNGQEAWELLQQERFDLLITDHQMPEMSGSELCQRIREDWQLAALPIFMLTGRELDPKRLREQFNLTEVMSKPFSPRELIARVQDCLLSGLAPKQ